MFENPQSILALAGAIIGVMSSLLSGIVITIVIPLFVYTFKREVKRIDMIEGDTDDIKNNYKKEFKEVRKDIADLKTYTMEGLGQIGILVGKIETTVEREERDSND